MTALYQALFQDKAINKKNIKISLLEVLTAWLEREVNISMFIVILGKNNDNLNKYSSKWKRCVGE